MVLTMETVREEISRVFKEFTGDFVIPKNAYEKRFCEILGWEPFDARYYDAFNGESFIEIKKGQAGMHFDMVRYAEIALGFGTQNTITVFFRWNKKHSRVEEAMIIDTKKIIEFLKIDRDYAKTYLKIHRRVPRGVNILASATAKDLREIATFVVKRRKPLLIYLRRPIKEYDTTTDSSKWPVINIYITYKATFGSDEYAMCTEKFEDIAT